MVMILAILQYQMVSKGSVSSILMMPKQPSTRQRQSLATNILRWIVKSVSIYVAVWKVETISRYALFHCPVLRPKNAPIVVLTTIVVLFRPHPMPKINSALQPNHSIASHQAHKCNHSIPCRMLHTLNPNLTTTRIILKTTNKHNTTTTTTTKCTFPIRTHHTKINSKPNILVPPGLLRILQQVQAIPPVMTVILLPALRI